MADVVAVACGTGGTLAGLAAGLGPGQRALGVPVLKGGGLPPGDAVRQLQRAAFGGPRGDWPWTTASTSAATPARTPELDAFADDFEDRHGLPVERLYVAKLLYGLTTLAEEGAFARQHGGRRDHRHPDRPRPDRRSAPGPRTAGGLSTASRPGVRHGYGHPPRYEAPSR